MACLVYRPHPLKIVVGVAWVWARLVQINTKVTAVGDASVANFNVRVGVTRKSCDFLPNVMLHSHVNKFVPWQKTHPPN